MTSRANLNFVRMTVTDDATNNATVVLRPPSTTVSGSAPLNPLEGDQWVDSNTWKTYTWYLNDGGTDYWVETGTAPTNGSSGTSGQNGSSGTAGSSGTSGQSSFPFTGSAQITGSLGVTGSLSVAGAIVANSFTGSLQAVDAVSARATGGVSVEGLQSVVNALSNRISIAQGASVANTAFVSVANVLNTAVLTGFSGMTVSVSAGVIYAFQGEIVYSISAATGNAFGLVWPTANRVAGQWLGGISVNGTGASTFSLLAVGDFDTGDSNSAVWSAGVGLGLHLVKVTGVIDVQTGGAFYPVGRASVATNTLTIARGSYFKLTRIN
jgi:hypothetical protein